VPGDRRFLPSRFRKVQEHRAAVNASDEEIPDQFLTFGQTRVWPKPAVDESSVLRTIGSVTRAVGIEGVGQT